MASLPLSAREAEIFANLRDVPDDDLIGIVAEGPGAVFPGADDDAAEFTAAACVILQRRLDGEGGAA